MKEKIISIQNNEKKLKFNAFKKFFILEFTKELIRNSSPSEVLKLKEIIKEEKPLPGSKEAKEKIKEIIQTKEKELSFISKDRKTQELKPSFPFAEKTPHLNPFRELKLTIPETRFPAHIQYIKPTPIKEEIELGKVNPLIQDPFVKIIECYGPNQNLVVKGKMGIKKTAIVLNTDEIDDIIKKFSEKTRIPISEGIYKVVAGRLIFLAIVSEIIGSKFIIKKMLYPQTPSPKI